MKILIKKEVEMKYEIGQEILIKAKVTGYKVDETGTTYMVTDLDGNNIYCVSGVKEEIIEEVK